jgi:hypothetical protein
MSSYEDELFISRLCFLIKVRDILDQLLRGCQNLALQLSKNYLMSRYVLTGQTYETALGIEDLQKYRSASHLLINVSIFISGKYLASSYFGATSTGNASQDLLQLTKRTTGTSSSFLIKLWILQYSSL